MKDCILVTTSHGTYWLHQHWLSTVPEILQRVNGPIHTTPQAKAVRAYWARVRAGEIPHPRKREAA